MFLVRSRSRRRAQSAHHDQRPSRSRQIDETYGPGSADLLDLVRPFTMTSEERIFALRDAVVHLVRRSIPGAFVECGVWRGGSAMVIAATLAQLGAEREVVLFDTFSGMTPPTDADIDLHGARAEDLLADGSPLREQYLARAALDDVRANLSLVDYPGHLIRYIEGPVERTLPAEAPASIALLRLDTDWYESTRHELMHLYPRVEAGGVVIIDDYGHFLGARRATDEYWATLPQAPLLTRIDYTGRLAVKP